MACMITTAGGCKSVNELNRPEATNRLVKSTPVRRVAGSFEMPRLNSPPKVAGEDPAPRTF